MVCENCRLPWGPLDWLALNEECEIVAFGFTKAEAKEKAIVAGVHCPLLIYGSEYQYYRKQKPKESKSQGGKMSLSFTREELIKARTENTERLQSRREKEMQKVKDHFINFVEKEYKNLKGQTIYKSEEYKFGTNDIRALGLIILSEKDIRNLLIDAIQQTREELGIKIAWCFGGLDNNIISASIDFFSDFGKEE